MCVDSGGHLCRAIHRGSAFRVRCHRGSVFRVFWFRVLGFGVM